MKKETMISGAMIAVAIVGAGYLYGDKIANKIGIDLHKPKAQVEETVSKKDEPAAEKKIKQSPDLDAFMNLGVSLKTAVHIQLCRFCKSCLDRLWNITPKKMTIS